MKSKTKTRKPCVSSATPAFRHIPIELLWGAGGKTVHCTWGLQRLLQRLQANQQITDGEHPRASQPELWDDNRDVAQTAYKPALGWADRFIEWPPSGGVWGGGVNQLALFPGAPTHPPIPTTLPPPPEGWGRSAVEWLYRCPPTLSPSIHFKNV